MSKNRIISQMFDIRPVNKAGDLHWKKIRQVKSNSASSSRFLQNKNAIREVRDNIEICQLGVFSKSEETPIFREVAQETLMWLEKERRIKKEIADEEKKYAEELRRAEFEREVIKKMNEREFFLAKANAKKKKHAERKIQRDLILKKLKSYLHEKMSVTGEKITDIKFFLKNKFVFQNAHGISVPKKIYTSFDLRRATFSFAAVSLLIALLIGSVFFIGHGWKVKGKVLGVSSSGYENLVSAVASIKQQDFQASSLKFEKSYEKFSEASKDLDHFGSFMTDISGWFPYASKLSSGKNAINAGKHISMAGKHLADFMKETENFKKFPNGEKMSLLDFLSISEENIKKSNFELKQANKYLDKIKNDDLPENKRDEFIILKQKMPEIIDISDEFLHNSHILRDIFGGNGPRKFLFLFQNNQEIRATGGFIGSYGLLDISNGRARNFFIDGIFNPDGQLIEKIVPPLPIQKISAAWSLHDSNWFPDFTISAQKAVLFYEKTGGPTVDGVITFTPYVMERLLKIIGPIEMKEYDVTLTAENFTEKTQYEVEEDYDKKENKPKKILSDLASILMEKVLNTEDYGMFLKITEAFVDSLNRKDILLYSTNSELQTIISKQGWSGELLSTQKDYLSIVNTNINGYKTDGVVDEAIEHISHIQGDGSIINSVIITRRHNGGGAEYKWWNKVNANYLRVYVPRGSELISVEGHTREINSPVFEYDSLGFKRDPDVEKEEKNMFIDKATGTRIYEESEKTVFANWTYVSPQETTVVKYSYRLPFKINLTEKNKSADSYSLLVQKQSGSKGSRFKSEVLYDKNALEPIWIYPESFQKDDSGKINYMTELNFDRFLAVTFKEKISD